MGGWVGGVEKLRIKLFQLSTKLKLKLKLSLAKFSKRSFWIRGNNFIDYLDNSILSFENKF